MIDKDQVLQFVKSKGPVLPRDAVKAFGGDTFLIGAVLSQLADAKLVKISSTKIGGSPVYYVAEQSDRLQDLYGHLHEKEKKAYDLLKEQKIIQDRSADPVVRVALRSIKDFAKPLEVAIKGEKEIFWKWYLLPNEEAESHIRSMLNVEPKARQMPKPRQPEPNVEPPKKEPAQKRLQAPSEEDHELMDELRAAFSRKGINILSHETLRKNSEIDMLITIPSPVGELKYFCKVRKKKKSNDKDLSSAYVQGQMKKLPVLYVTTGELTKKAEEMLAHEFKMISVMRL